MELSKKSDSEFPWFIPQVGGTPPSAPGKSGLRAFFVFESGLSQLSQGTVL